MAYTASTNVENEKKYLQNLASTGTAGQQAWANSQMQKLNEFTKSQAKPTTQQPQQTVSTPVNTAVGQAAGGGSWSTDQQGQKWYSVGGTDYNMSAPAKIAQATAPKQPTTQPTIDDTYAKQIAQQQAEAQRQAQQQAELLAQQKAEAERILRAQIDQGVGQLEGSKGGIDQAYEQAAREAYIRNQKETNLLPQQFAASGITGGMAQRGLQDVSLAYQNAQNQGRLARDNQITNIDRDINNLQTTGDISIAQNAIEYQARLAEELKQAALRQQEQSRWQAELEAQMAQQQWTREQQLAQQQWNQQTWQSEFDANQAKNEQSQGQADYNNRLNLAKIAAQYGDFSGLRQLGIDTSQLEQQYAAQMVTPSTAQRSTANRSSGSSPVGSLGFSDPEPAPTASTVINPATLVPRGQEGAFDQTQAINLAQRGFTPEQIASIMNTQKSLLSWRG